MERVSVETESVRCHRAVMLSDALTVTIGAIVAEGISPAMDALAIFFDEQSACSTTGPAFTANGNRNVPPEQDVEPAILSLAELSDSIQPERWGMQPHSKLRNLTRTAHVFERVIVYIDGFNLYYGMRSKRWQRYYWLNVQLLAQHLLKPGQTLIGTKYFTSRVSSTQRDPNKNNRQSTYLEALGTLADVDIFYGHYLEKTVWSGGRQTAVLGRKLRNRLKDGVVQARDVDKADSRMALERLVVHESTDSATAWAEIEENLKTIIDKMNLAEKRLNGEIAQAMT